MNLFSAIAMIAMGSIAAASFYVPLKKVKNWSWESYWLLQGVAAWLIFPWIAVLLTVPSGQLFPILHDVSSSSKWMAIFFGALWGVGGLTFGLSIRYLGIAMGQSIALGFCAAFGTLIPPIIAGENLLSSKSGIMMVVGVAVCLAGIAIIGYAGALKNKGLTEEERKKAVAEFALKKGLLIALLAGVMSAAMSFGFQFGAPIDAVCVNHGMNPLFQSNITLAFILVGGFVTNLIYCVYLNIKNKTYTDYTQSSMSVVGNNIFYTFFAGLLWFLQFHFYGMGKSQLPADIAPFGWSILMALNIAIGNIWGITLGEWKGVSSKTMYTLIIGIIVLMFSTIVVKLG